MGQSICQRSSTERMKKTAEEVEEALLAIHVASNGSHESTDPNCSFRLQDPCGILLEICPRGNNKLVIIIYFIVHDNRLLSMLELY